MLFVNQRASMCGEASVEGAFDDMRLPFYFTLLVATEQVVDPDSFERLARRTENHKRTSQHAPCKCQRCRDVGEVRRMLQGPRFGVRLLPVESR